MWRWIRFCRRPVSLSSSAKILSDSRTCRTSSQAEPSTWAPFHIIAASTTTTAEFSAAIDRMRQRIGTARTSPTMRERPRAARLAGRTAISSCWAVPKANSLHPDLVAAAAALGDQAAHALQRLDGGIVLALGIGGAKFPRDRARRDRRQKQRDNDCYGPRKVGAAVHRKLHPFMMMSRAGQKGSMELNRRRDTGILPAPLASSIVSCARPLRIATAGAGFYQGARYAKSRSAPPRIRMDSW